MRLALLALPVTICALAPCHTLAQPSDLPVRDSRDHPLSPQETLASIEFDGDYEAQLVACEPLISDPVELAWDEKGRLFVADMIDYPLGPAEGDPPLSRIQQLIDDDGDGRMDRALTFADHLDHVQGLLPHDGGLIATTRTQILFLKDTTGDGSADEIRPLFEGFNPKHSQLQVSSPRWGPDGCVYFNNGLSADEVYPSPASESPSPTKIARTNFKWNPRTGEVSPVTGYGQYGAAFDDWGHYFFCSNRNPLMFAVMPYEAVHRNPHAGIEKGYEDIAPAGADTRVYPLQITHTTADAHAGTNTACCGLGVYRGPLMPELKNNVFVCDPSAQLITRYTIEPNGASLKATRVGDHTEFFRSSDEWCRPVNITTGPDGALYVCDIYRRWIDHARFFPEDYVKKHNMRQGDTEGRIYRIVPKAHVGVKALADQSIAPTTTERLIAWLGHENAWQRETAQRLLIERILSPDPDAALAFYNSIASSEHPHADLHSTATAHAISLACVTSPELTKVLTLPKEGSRRDSLNALFDHKAMEAKGWLHNRELFLSHWSTWVDHYGAHDAVSASESESARVAFFGLACLNHISPAFGQEEAEKACLRVLARWPNDPWLHSMVLAYGGDVLAPVLTRLLNDPWTDTPTSSSPASFVRQATFAITSAASDPSVPSPLHDLLALLQTHPHHLTWWKPALLQGLAEGLPKSGGKLGVQSLAEFIAKPPAGFEDTAAEIQSLLKQIDTVMVDPTAPKDQRLAVLPLLSQRPWADAEPVLRDLFTETATTGGPLRDAALAALKKYPANTSTPLLYDLLKGTQPDLRREAVTLLAANSKTVLNLFQRMAAGEFSPALIDAETRWRYLHNEGKIGDLARQLFDQPDADRAAVIADYLPCTTQTGDAEKGKQIFLLNCSACHRIGDQGADVGPALSDVRVKPPEALLADILDPNRMFEARWSAYQIDTHDGRTFSGLLDSESADTITLKLMGGSTHSVPRSEVKTFQPLDRTLMPVGLEAAISQDQMADLLTFLQK